MKNSLWRWNFMISDWDMFWDCHSGENIDHYLQENNPTNLVVMSEYKPAVAVNVTLKERVTEFFMHSQCVH